MKYDCTEKQDNIIIRHVAELANKKQISMTKVSLAWLLKKVDSPVVGATKLHHIESAVNALNVELTEDEINYLEEAYMPHKLVGVMAQSKPVFK